MRSAPLSSGRLILPPSWPLSPPATAGLWEGWQGGDAEARVFELKTILRTVTSPRPCLVARCFPPVAWVDSEARGAEPKAILRTVTSPRPCLVARCSPSVAWVDSERARRVVAGEIREMCL